jgi:hypothetical protein
MKKLLIILSILALSACGDSNLGGNNGVDTPQPDPQPQPQPDPEPAPIPDPELDAALRDQHVNMVAADGSVTDMVLRDNHSFIFIKNDAVTGNNYATQGTWEAVEGAVITTYTVDGVDYVTTALIPDGAVPNGRVIDKADDTRVSTITDIIWVKYYGMKQASDPTWIDYANTRWEPLIWLN